VELLVATGNAGKLREIRRLLADERVTVYGLEDFSELPEIVEDGETFQQNALKKARTIAEHTGKLTLADDSGLVVEFLDGAPGVYSARYSGTDADDAVNNRKLLAEMAGVPLQKRRAAFCCAMALVTPLGEVHEVCGRVEGVILETPRGEGGFGYDPLFWVPDYQQSMAEIPLEEKNRISHRGQALKLMLPILHQLNLTLTN